MTDAGLSTPRAARAAQRASDSHALSAQGLPSSHAHSAQLPPDSEAIAPRLLAWFDVHGRHDLPWQRDAHAVSRLAVGGHAAADAGRARCCRYYERFVARFPTVAALARAPLDDVLTLWSGLGYYARARNLHRARAGGRRATRRRVAARRSTSSRTLPGIGRSTAAAILAHACGERVAILDGNVKRVLARHARASTAGPASATCRRELWALAERHTPRERVADYTQAIMDLGATLCTRARPACTRLPARRDCAAARAARSRSIRRRGRTRSARAAA